MGSRIFLCHAKEDQAQVEVIYDYLRALGFEPWMDKRDLIAGQRWQREIPQALKDSALVLICLSKHIGRPGYVQREFKLALDALQEIPEEMIHTVPVRLEPCQVPELFASLHWCDLFVSDGSDRLEEAIRYGLEQRGEALELNAAGVSSSEEHVLVVNQNRVPSATKIDDTAMLQTRRLNLLWLPMVVIVLVIVGLFYFPRLFPLSSEDPGPHAWRDLTIEEWYAGEKWYEGNR
ncbi:MAG: hypothetical protein ETSY2_04275 [Candidatus Entotheonella gemina]|uniref:TIR domain-containing protein n=1 Tax=Candidatus Entotheonella gemina TaxID=1429439 RepID=W4MG23_9BACT|nr:MAG: hypothetical protein ETSY2_04275 [Candidatus Entotheonella gemina]